MGLCSEREGEVASSAHGKDRPSYKETVTGRGSPEQEDASELDDEGDVSDDDVVEEGNGSTWFGIGMSREEKIAAR